MKFGHKCKFKKFSGWIWMTKPSLESSLDKILQKSRPYNSIFSKTLKSFCDKFHVNIFISLDKLVYSYKQFDNGIILFVRKVRCKISVYLYTHVYRENIISIFTK